MTATTTTKTTARKPAAAKSVLITIDTLRLAPGMYKKVGRTRTGRAFLSVGTDGSLSYCNRRGESRVLLAKEFVAIYSTGIATLIA